MPTVGPGEETHGIVTQHIFSDREMLRSHRIVVVCIVKVIWIRQITFNNISDAGIRRDAIEREFLDLDFIEKAKIADRKRFALGGGIQTVGVEVCDITTLLGVVISLHILIVGRRISLGNGGNTTSQIRFRHEICDGV